MDDTKKNAYTVLELEPSPDVDDNAIKKAYRRLAILKHPDKNRDNPKAAEEFGELEQAYRLLLDKDARGALDDLLRAQAQRAARVSQVSEKRRKLKEELEKRERQSASERSEEEMARHRLKIELERLRRKAEEEERRQRQQAAELSAAIAVQRAAAVAAAGAPGGGGASAAYSDGNGDGAPAEAVQAQLRRTLKVTWDPTCREYSTEELRSIFGGFGAPVQDVVLRDRKKKRKVTALVVMATETAAVAAAGNVCGDSSEPLLVVPLVGHLAAEGDQQRDGGDEGPRVAAGVSGDGGGARPKPQHQESPDGGLLSRDGGMGSAAAAGPGPQSLLQRPARLPDPPAGTSGRPLFPAAGRGTAGGSTTAAFPAPGGGGLFPSAAAAAAAVRPAMSFPSGPGPGDGGPAFSSWRASTPGGMGASGDRGGTASGLGSTFEDEVLEKMRRAAAARQAAATAAKEALG
ncbi:hypothetical protein Vafri_10633 [Volvox africanus]|uniref:J domain-containing protein n=1 Tax=Volvox africanus TaxID=51714 RepID=A0A8J4B6M4_9CHLO|nr:hypothetical protein Vafri_10633 [Volvox africanus]